MKPSTRQAALQMLAGAGLTLFIIVGGIGLGLGTAQIISRVCR